MGIKFIKYSRSQRASCRVIGYSLYVNSSHRTIRDSMHEIMREAHHYSYWSDIEIYPILARS